MKTAILYYSRRGGNWKNGEVQNLERGNTETLAGYLKDITEGDLFEIQMVTPYSDDYDTCVDQAKRDQEQNILPEVLPLPDLTSYDILYLGYPIFWQDLPQPVVSALKQQSLEGLIVYPFATHEGSGLGASISHLKDLLPSCEILDPLPFPGSLVERGFNRMRNWVERHEVTL